jgi:hypothetical protein
MSHRVLVLVARKPIAHGEASSPGPHAVVIGTRFDAFELPTPLALA